MHQPKGALQRRYSKTTSMNLDVRQRVASICAPRPASFHECLEAALSRPGEIQWGGVQDMVQVLVQELVSPHEALKTLKPYLRSNMPAVILKILTIVDALIFNCGERVYEAMLLDKWNSRVARLASHSDNKVKHAALQLISNYAQSYNGTSFGDVFAEIAVSLTTKGFILPVAAPASINFKKKSIDSANVDEVFTKGIDFLQFPYPDSSTSESSNTDEEQFPEPGDISLTIQKIDNDVSKLMDAISQCHHITKTFKVGGCTRKEILDRLNMAWVVAEKCHVWSENMQAFLTKDLSHDDLTALLRTNDKLQEGLCSWEGLVSMDIVNSGHSDNDSHSSTDGTKWGLKARHIADSAIDQDHSPTDEMERLKVENEGLRQSLSDLEAAQQREMLKTDADYRSSLKDVKSKAASRIKDLLRQIADYELKEKRLKRDAEDALLKLKTADQALLDKDQETDRLEVEAADIREELERRVEEARQCQLEIESQLQEKTAQAADLIVQLTSKQGNDLAPPVPPDTDNRANHHVVDELDAERAKARADAANYLAKIELLTRQVEKMTRESQQLRIEEYEQKMANLKLELKRESILRKKAFNHIRELKGNIRVIARIRPVQDGTPEDELAIRMHDDYTIEHLSKLSASVGAPRRDPEDGVKRYEFDACFGPKATQGEVYAETQGLIQSAMDGYNVCIFCYGQTGSGKTHTLTGYGENPGIVPLFMEDVFSSDSTVQQTSVSCYMLELYQDDLLDLLSPTSRKGKMSIRTDSETGLVSVKGATQVDVRNAAELKSAFDAGIKRRKTATTRCNISSSRSHLIFTVLLERVHVITGSHTKSKITFVDLAGSERVVKSGAVNDKERLNEAKAINKSLSALGDVVSALTSRESFVPYRNHKLTELMRDSLGGSAKTLMIVNISPLPSDARETQNTLDYAQRAKQVTNENSRSYETRELARLKAINEKQAREIQQLKALAAKTS